MMRKPENRLFSLWISLRPHQWIKNFLVFGGLVFSRSLHSGGAVLLSLWAFLLFCMASSGVYLFNDWLDLDSDRQHPHKKNRPLAAGDLSALEVLSASFLLATAAILLAWKFVPGLLATLILYLGICVLYCSGLKKWRGIDLLILSAGFVLRAVGGAEVIAVPPSPWLILCTFLLALLVGAGKRRQELFMLRDVAVNHRSCLQHYTIEFLDRFMVVAGATAVATFLSYALISPLLNPGERKGMLLSVPFVAFGVSRYIVLVQHRCKGGDPARLFLEDPLSLFNGLVWVLIIYLSIYWF
jgi:4-hydroxybenzoate polyprenyltransferase